MRRWSHAIIYVLFCIKTSAFWWPATRENIKDFPPNSRCIFARNNLLDLSHLGFTTVLLLADFSAFSFTTLLYIYLCSQWLKRINASLLKTIFFRFNFALNLIKCTLNMQQNVSKSKISNCRCFTLNPSETVYNFVISLGCSQIPLKISAVMRSN